MAGLGLGLNFWHVVVVVAGLLGGFAGLTVVSRLGLSVV